MTVRVMGIGNVGMHMPSRLVLVPVAVLVRRCHTVGVIVMPVIVAVRVFVRQRLKELGSEELGSNWGQVKLAQIGVKSP